MVCQKPQPSHTKRNIKFTLNLKPNCNRFVVWLMNNYLIVGANSGIGFALAQNLTNSNVIALSRKGNNIALLNNAKFYQVDNSLPEPNFPEINEPLHGIIYCPGSINLKPFKAFKPEDFLTDFNLNFLGAVKTIKKYFANLQIGSTIILFSTVAVQVGMPFHSSIAAAKGAIEGLTKSLAAEFAPKIRVNCIAPSLINTPLAEKLLNSNQKLESAKERHPLKEIGSTNDMAQAVKYLLHANWVTGQILHVDGGISAIK